LTGQRASLIQVGPAAVDPRHATSISRTTPEVMLSVQTLPRRLARRERGANPQGYPFAGVFFLGRGHGAARLLPDVAR
jgi:hypothetical protein